MVMNDESSSAQMHHCTRVHKVQSGTDESMRCELGFGVNYVRGSQDKRCLHNVSRASPGGATARRQLTSANVAR